MTLGHLCECRYWEPGDDLGSEVLTHECDTCDRRLPEEEALCCVGCDAVQCQYCRTDYGQCGCDGMD